MQSTEFTIESLISEQARHGFRVIESHPQRTDLKAGTRVHNRGEQFHAARSAGTASVAAIMRRGTDDQPDSWERSYGRPNIEVVVVHDNGYVTSWADYGTETARGLDSQLS